MKRRPDLWYLLLEPGTVKVVPLEEGIWHPGVVVAFGGLSFSIITSTSCNG